MRLPTLIDLDFVPLEASASDRDLYEKLSGNTAHLVRFFTQAVDDETWTGKHEKFIGLSLSLFTTLFTQGRLALAPAKEVVGAFHKHHAILFHLLPKNYPIKVHETTYLTNPLLIGVMSPYLLDLMNNQPERKGLLLTDVDLEEFKSLLNYMEEGKWEGLFRFNREEMEKLLVLAEKFKLSGLSEECQSTMVRYIDIDNGCEILLDSMQKGREFLKNASIERINKDFSGARLYDLEEGSIGFEFIDYGDKSRDFFIRLLPRIAEVQLSGNLPKHTELLDLLNKGSRLISLNLSFSEVFNQALFTIPKNIYSLNLSRCEWLSDAIFKEISRRMPWIQKLDLSGNTQLTFVSFNALKEFPRLTELNLSGLPHLSEQEVSLIKSSVQPGAQVIL